MPSRTHGDHLGRAGRPERPSGRPSGREPSFFDSGRRRPPERSPGGGGGGGGVGSLMGSCYDRGARAGMAEGEIHPHL